MVTIKIIKELSNHYIRGNLSRFDDKLIKKLKNAKVNDRLVIDEKYLPQCASFAVLEDGTKITPLKVLAISTITTTNGEMLVGIYGGARKMSNGTFSVTVDDTTDIVYGRLVRVTNTNSIDIINNYFLFTNSTAYPAPGGTNYSVEFFNEDFQFLGKTPLFTIKNDYSEIETGPPVITEDFTGTSDSALQLTLTMSPLYDGFTYDNSFDALNWRVSIITLNGDKQTLNGWINDGIAVISGDNHEILTITYNEIATHWLVGVSFIWCANSRKKINETYSYPPGGGTGPTDISGDITPTDPTEAGGNGSASFDVDTGLCTGVSTASLDPANGTTPISLENGVNTGVVFEDLPPDDYTLNVYCDDEIIATGDFTINDFVPPTTEITNVVPTDPTEEGGNGSVTFDATVSDCTGDSVCRLNPPAGTADIPLTEGANTGLTFTDLPPDTYTIEAYCDDVLMGSEEFTINDFVAPPTAIITNVVPTDATTNGGTDGTITFDVEISDFTDTPTVVLNPANGTDPITLTDGTNTGISFDTLPAGTYTIEVYDGTTLITSEEGVVVSEPDAPTGGIDNIVPTSPTTEDGTDGSIDFDANSTGCTGTSTAVLNPDAGTSPITLTEGDNTGLTFTDLPAGTYTIQIYCDDTLVDESDDIIIPAYTPPASGTIDNIVPTSPTTEGGTDGEISFDANSTGCTGDATAVLNPASGTTPIALTDGDNTGLVFSPLPAGDYTIQIYCDDTLVEESDTITIPDFVAPATADIINTVPTAPTTSGGSDGSIGFDVTTDGCDGVQTAALNPASGTTPITLTTGDNTGLSFDGLTPGDYTIQVYCDSTLIEESDTITVPDFVAPTGDITNIVPTAPTTEDNDDGEISFDTDVTGCTGTKTAVLNPAAGTTPITLVDGTNTGVSFAPLPAGDYTIQIYCDSTLIEESDTITIPAYTTPVDVDITNIIPNAPTTEGGTDGNISFAINIDGCDGVQTAVLNPAAGTTPITLTTGSNNGLVFEDLEPGTYTIQVYCDETLVDESADIIVPDYTVPEADIIDVLTPTDGDLIPPDGTDIPVNDGGNLSHKLLMTNGSFKPDEGIQCYQNLFIVGSEFTAEEWTAACLNTYNPDDPQGDKCFLAIKRASDNTLDLIREEDADSIDGLTWIKAIDNITVTKILPNTALNTGDTFTFTDDYTNYDFLISKWYFSTSNDSTVGPQYGYPIRDTSDLGITSTWMQKQHESNTDFNGILDITGPLSGKVTKAHAFDFLATIVGVKGFPTPIDLNISVSGTTITADDYADADFLVINTTYSGTGNTQLMYAKEIVYDGITRYDFIGIGACYFSFNADKTINVIDSALGATIVVTSIKKIVLA